MRTGTESNLSAWWMDAEWESPPLGGFRSRQRLASAAHPQTGQMTCYMARGGGGVGACELVLSCASLEMRGAPPSLSCDPLGVSTWGKRPPSLLGVRGAPLLLSCDPLGVRLPLRPLIAPAPAPPPMGCRFATGGGAMLFVTLAVPPD